MRELQIHYLLSLSSLRRSSLILSFRFLCPGGEDLTSGGMKYKGREKDMPGLPDTQEARHRACVRLCTVEAGLAKRSRLAVCAFPTSDAGYPRD